MTRILLVDEDVAFTEMLRCNLVHAGFEAIPFPSGEAAMVSIHKYRADLVITECALPGMTGIDVCRRLRSSEETRHLPVIMLSVRTAEADKVAGLDAGADDYVVKPFSNADLLARIEAVLRRSRTPMVIAARSGIALNLQMLRACRFNHLMDIHQIEFHLLLHFVRHADAICDRRELLEAVWGQGSPIDERTVDVNVYRLRRALTARGWPDPIRTVKGAGYIFEDRAVPPAQRCLGMNAPAPSCCPLSL